MQQSLVDDVLHLASRYNEMGDRWAVAADKASKVLLTTEEKQKTYRGLIPAVVSLSSQATESEVRAAVQRLADERGCTFDEACQMIICTAKADRFAERVLKLRAVGHDATTALNLAQREDPEGATAWREAGLN